MMDLDSGKEVKVKRIKVNSVKDSSRGIVFQRAEIKILRKIPMFIPLSIEKALIGLNEKFPGVEFSIFGKGVWNEDESHLEIEETFVIPAQEVSGGHIEYLEDPGIEFDAVIHKHPSGCHSFSGTDWKFINSNCRHSALWCDGQFWEATTSIFYEPYDCNIRLPVEVYTEQTRGIIPTGADNIKVKTTPRQFHIPGIGGPYRSGESRDATGNPMLDIAGGRDILGVPDYDGPMHRSAIENILGEEITGEELLGGFIDDSDDETDMDSRVQTKRFDDMMKEFKSKRDDAGRRIL